MKSSLIIKTSIIVAVLAFTGCITRIYKPEGEPSSAKMKFGEFKNIEIKSVEIDPKYARNIKAQRKIDELFAGNIATAFPDYKRIETGSEFSKTSVRTLQITPRIEQVKFVSIAKRIFAGPFPGSSAVIMRVTFRDSSTGKVIADPQFYRRTNAMLGWVTIGIMDNVMLSTITRDVRDYAISNK